MYKQRGFSLMEMMVVLLIVSIVTAAAAPMINKKVIGTASEKSPWVWIGTDKSIAYNLQGSNEQIAAIGTSNPGFSKNKPKFFIKSADSNNPHIAFQNKTETPLKFMWSKNSVALTTKDFDNNGLSANTVMVGNSANAYMSQNTVVIGSEAQAHGFMDTVVIGRNAKTLTGGGAAIAVGANSLVSSHSVAIGNSSSSNYSSVAVGSTSRADATNTVAIGNYARARMPRSIAIGQNAYVPSGNSVQARAIAIGYNAHATHSDAIAIGGKYGANATRAINTGAIAIGATALASGYQSIAIGGTSNNTTNVDYGSAPTTMAIAPQSIALGMEATASGTNSISIGFQPRAPYNDSIAIGTASNVTAANSLAIGYRANISGTSSRNSVAIGYNSKALNGEAVALGPGANASGFGAVAIGDRVNSSGGDSIAIGTEARASGWASTALGYNARSNCNYSTAIGYNAAATADNQIVLGNLYTTVWIPGRLIIGPNSGYDTPSKSNWLLHVRGISFLGPKKKTEEQIFTGSRDGWGCFYRSAESGNDDVKISNSGCDRRLKNVGEVFKGGLTELKKLPLYHFTYKKDEKKIPHVGVMAQDLQKVFPNAVSKREDGFLQIRFEDLFYALVNAVKELDAKIESLNNNEIMILNKKVVQLENENKALKKEQAIILKRLSELEKKVK